MFWNHGDCYSAQRWTGSGKGQPMNKFKDGYRDINPVKISGLSDKCLVLQNWRLILRMLDDDGDDLYELKKDAPDWVLTELKKRNII